MKNVIITGANGKLAKSLINFLLKNTTYKLFLITTNIQSITQLYNDQQFVYFFTLDEFRLFAENSTISFDSLIHTAFARSQQGVNLVESLSFTSRVIQIAKSIRLKSFLNISSQSIYGSQSKGAWVENITPNPKDMYGLAKFAAERLCSDSLCDTKIQCSNIRLDSIFSNTENFVNLFAGWMLTRTPITITTPKQERSFIDERDAALALHAIIENPKQHPLHSIYNLGTNQIYTIETIASLMNTKCQELYGTSTEIITNEHTDIFPVGMNSSLLMKTFEWRPRYSIDKMIERILQTAYSKLKQL